MRKLQVENEDYLLSGLGGAPGEEGQAPFGPRFHVLHFIRAKADFAYRIHKHPSFEMIIPLKGVYKCLLNGEELSLGPGEALLIQPGDTHQDLYLPGMEYCGSIFELAMPGAPSGGRKLFRKEIKPSEQASEIQSLETLLKARDAFAKESQEGGLFAEYRAAAAAQACFWEALSSIPKKLLAPEFLERPEKDAFRKKLLRRFEEAATQKLNLDAMAQAMGISKSSLSHKCAELLGAPPAKAFLDFRLGKAKSLMEEQGLSVKEACLALGFANQFHFSRAFKRRFGSAPSKSK